MDHSQSHIQNQPYSQTGSGDIYFRHGENSADSIETHSDLIPSSAIQFSSNHAFHHNHLASIIHHDHHPPIHQIFERVNDRYNFFSDYPHDLCPDYYIDRIHQSPSPSPTQSDHEYRNIRSTRKITPSYHQSDHYFHPDLSLERQWQRQLENGQVDRNGMPIISPPDDLTNISLRNNGPSSFQNQSAHLITNVGHRKVDGLGLQFALSQSYYTLPQDQEFIFNGDLHSSPVCLR
ncbi:hypothetical protein O181_055963 [Austropuccinia psidii MF-1]|uniref:Uncharacterized protein n=1 Tax=Austropuccinia psidii MF-1 TaxID=1389203 RepID=A0A9Q3HSZ8_9BASI|nr:hypothetical protein [Austropuccinia psidii MF-1]